MLLGYLDTALLLTANPGDCFGLWDRNQKHIGLVKVVSVVQDSVQVDLILDSQPVSIVPESLEGQN